MSFLKNIKNFLYKADIFYTTELLRYKGEPEFRTLFGGVLSVILIITLIGTFQNKLVDTLNKVVITSISSNQNAANPTPYTISTYPEAKFMFGVEVWHHNLNDELRYFDVVLTSAEFATGEPLARSVQRDLEPCEMSHWEGFPDVQQNFTRLKMDQWLCLPRNQTYNIQGKYASQFSQTLQVAVLSCTNSSKFSTPCAPQDQIDKYFEQAGQFYFTIYFINPLINPTSQEYLTYYLEDMNYIIFTKTLGAEGILMLQEFKITTDESIFPFSNLRDDEGGIVNQVAIKNPYALDANTGQKANVYCSFSFFKSGLKRTYQRNFQKIDQILSYIGGLFGTIAVALFIINAYNSSSFQVVLGASLFHNSTEKQENKLKKYNFLNYLVHLLYIALSLIGFSPNWKNIKQYDECKEEIKKQLDICYLLDRLFFLQRTMNTLLEQHQVKGLFLHERLTLEQAKKNRHNFKARRIIMKKYQEFKNKQKLKKDIDQNDLKNYRKDSLKDPIKITEQTLQMIDPVIYEAKKQDILMQVKSTSNQLEISQIQKLKRNKIFPQFKIQPSDQESSQITGQSDSQDDQIQINFNEDIARLKKQSEKGNGLSFRIWQRIKPSLRKKLSKLEESESKSQNFATSKKQTDSDNSIKQCLDFPQSNHLSRDSQSQTKFIRPSKMKIKNTKQLTVQCSHERDSQQNQLRTFENVLIENQLKRSPTNFP